MDNEDCGAENGFLSTKSLLVDAEAIDEGMQKFVNGDNDVPGRVTLPSPSLWQSNEAENAIVPGRENGEPLSFWQSTEEENAIESEDGFAPPLNQGSALPPHPDEQQESAPIEGASEKGGLIDSKRAADIDPADMEPQIEGLEEIRQGEASVQNEQDSAVKASAEIQHELDGEPSVEVQSFASNLCKTKPERQDLALPEQDNTGDSELGEGETSGREEYDIDEMQEQLVNDAAGTSFTMGVSQEAGVVQQHVAPELVEKDIEVNSEKSQQIPDDALLMKEPSLSTQAMEALINADNEEPSHEQESFGTVENCEQLMEATETHEEYAGGDRQDAFEGISNLVEVDNIEQERAENNSFDEDFSSLAVAESADEVLIPSYQADIPTTDEVPKEELGNELPIVLTEQHPINEPPSMEPHGERELVIEAPLAIGLEPMEQSLDTAPCSSDLEMAADSNEKGDEAVPLKVDDTVNADLAEAATSEVEGDAITESLEETYTENESGLQALNGEQGLNNPHNKESDETFNKELDTEGLPTGKNKCSVQTNDEALPSEGQTGFSKAEAKIDAANVQFDEDDTKKRVHDDQGSVYTTPCSDTLIEALHHIENCHKSSSQSEPSSESEHEGQGVGNTTTTIQLESTADDISNGVLESSVTFEGPNKVYVLENGDSLQGCPYRENGGEVGGSYMGHSTEPVLELGKLSDGMTKGEAPIMGFSGKGLAYHGMIAEDDKQSTSKPLINNDSESEDESSRVIEIGTLAAEAKDGDLVACKGKEIAGGPKGVPSHTDVTSTTNSLAKENGFLKHSEGDFEKESQAKNTQAFHNERSREASLPLLVPDRVCEHMGRKDADCMNGRVTLALRTNWWGCCGMLDLLLHKDQ